MSLENGLKSLGKFLLFFLNSEVRPMIKYKIGDGIKKNYVPGTAWCMWCEDKISYANTV